jgi:NAD-dependent dihydropyrimidine dehydrogenase PreA subunit
MPRKHKPSKSSNLNTFQLLTKTTEEAKNKRIEEFLAALGVEEFFVDGSITINKRTCKGVECKLCIEACPTYALFWKVGEVGIVKELCIYCGACVLSCIVNDCIKIERKRVTGEVEKFSKPRDFTALQHGINVKKRRGKIQEVFPKVEDYLKQYKKKKT